MGGGGTRPARLPAASCLGGVPAHTSLEPSAAAAAGRFFAAEPSAYLVFLRVVRPGTQPVFREGK
jgi:hypothetical protein